jgi:hypothetical protein
MKVNNSIIISEKDYNDLINMLESLSTSEFKKASFLEEEMLRADIVQSEKLPQEVVAMNSQVRFLDIESGEVLESSGHLPLGFRYRRRKGVRAGAYRKCAFRFGGGSGNFLAPSKRSN